jgi:hypothetical protein
MTEMQRQNGIRSFQSEFSNSNKFARHMSAEESTMSKPTVLLDFHLAFIRLCKRYRFTEHVARELIPYIYTGPAARQYTKVKKRSPQATTEALMAEMGEDAHQWGHTKASFLGDSQATTFCYCLEPPCSCRRLDQAVAHVLLQLPAGGPDR